MSLIDQTLFGNIDKVQVAIERLREFEPEKGYYLAFSGGKDSQCIYHLAVMSGVKFDAHYNVTTVDPPVLVKFIKSNYPDVKFDKPKLSMFQLISTKVMPPTRIVRYCCQHLKEDGGNGRIVVTGIRRAESTKRAGRKLFETCNKSKLKHYLHPIIDWGEDDVWEFIHSQKLEYCKLYDEGYKRIGCILCPMKTYADKLLDIKRFPRFKKAYIKAFDNMLKKRDKRGLVTDTWSTGEEVFDWWIKADYIKTNPDQTQMFEE